MIVTYFEDAEEENDGDDEDGDVEDQQDHVHGVDRTGFVTICRVEGGKRKRKCGKELNNKNDDDNDNYIFAEVHLSAKLL